MISKEIKFRRWLQGYKKIYINWLTADQLLSVASNSTSKFHKNELLRK